jgi:hypothetical protein
MKTYTEKQIQDTYVSILEEAEKLKDNYQQLYRDTKDEEVRKQLLEMLQLYSKFTYILFKNYKELGLFNISDNESPQPEQTK